jgi:ubiquinol-cytochrome c reductase cytochrome b subunit
LVLLFTLWNIRIPHVNNQEGAEIDFDEEAKKYLAGNTKEAKVIRFQWDFLSKDFMVLGFFLILFFYLNISSILICNGSS